MSFWLRLLHALGFYTPVEKTYYLDEEVVKSLQMLAEQEQRSEGEVAAHLITNAVSRRRASRETLTRWLSLSPREQQVAMMICHNYTTGEMAAQLVVSTNTVKTHIRSVLHKFNVHSRGELRLVLTDFDFDQL
jgi:DNA-binding CsgD family transcriptional regulator